MYSFIFRWCNLKTFWIYIYFHNIYIIIFIYVAARKRARTRLYSEERIRCSANASCDRLARASLCWSIYIVFFVERKSTKQCKEVIIKIQRPIFFTFFFLYHLYCISCKHNLNVGTWERMSTSIFLWYFYSKDLYFVRAFISLLSILRRVFSFQIYPIPSMGI